MLLRPILISAPNLRQIALYFASYDTSFPITNGVETTTIGTSVVMHSVQIQLVDHAGHEQYLVTSPSSFRPMLGNQNYFFIELSYALRALSS